MSFPRHSTPHTAHCTLRTPNFKLHTPHFTLHTPHFSLLTASSTLQTSHFTLHTALFALRTPNLHFTLHTPHFTLLTSHCFLHTSHFTLHSLRPTLHTTLNLRATKKTLAPKWRKSANKCISRPSCRLQDDLRDPAAKVNRITNAATARSNLDAAITLRSAEIELQNIIELRATASEIIAPKPDLDARAKKKTILKHFLNAFSEGKSLAPKWRKSADKSLWQPSCSHANTIYEVQLQKTIVSRMQPQHEATLQSHLHCGNDPRVANHNGIPSATHPPAPLAIPFTMRERSYSCKSQWNSVDRTCTKNSWNPIYNAEPIRAWSEHDPPMIRPHTRPSRNRRTAEVDHRGSGTDFVWKNIGFRASAISQKRISCETYSFKTPSATHPPAPLATPFTMRERSYSCKSQWNSVDRTCTKNSWNPIYNAEPIRAWSEHDPPMIRPHTRPSRNRRTAEVDHRGSGTDFVWKNIGFRASAISQKRISCETYSFKTPSATPPPAPLAMPF